MKKRILYNIKKCVYFLCKFKTNVRYKSTYLPVDICLKTVYDRRGVVFRIA